LGVVCGQSAFVLHMTLWFKPVHVSTHAVLIARGGKVPKVVSQHTLGAGQF
jgi:hypothetical protein